MMRMERVDHDIVVFPSFEGRLCNNILQAYRGMWFATMHEIPFDRVVFEDKNGIPGRSRLFDSLRKNFRDYGYINELNARIDVTFNASEDSMQRVRLSDIDISGVGRLKIRGHAFVYPELPWERALFLSMFDNRQVRDAVFSKYGELLYGNTVGYTVRRTDLVHWAKFFTMKRDHVTKELKDIVARYHGMVNILVSTDDTDGFVESIISDNSDLTGHVHVIHDNEDNSLYLMSMCDVVVNNSDMQCSAAWENYERSYFLSTFGQVAQLLNRSYKYAGIAYTPDMRRSSRDWTYADFPVFNLPKGL